MTASPTPTSTPDPIASIEFVDNDDCRDLDRNLLPTVDLTLSFQDVSLSVIAEVADEAWERQQGLMCRAVVPGGTGMLFVFEQARALRFWMLNTYEPLDILYLDSERGVVNALRMRPCPRPGGANDGAWRSACTAAASGYGSNVDAEYALELPAGWLESNGWSLDELEGVEVSW